MSFPQRMPEKIDSTAEIEEVFGSGVLELYSERDLYVVMKSEQTVRDFVPRYDELRRLQKENLLARQLSARGGTLYCEMGEEDVKISGEAVLYMMGEIII